MKIALLNLPVDNNYGGMLQRYALTKVLEDMGYEATHLNLRFPINSGPLFYRLARDVKRFIKKSVGKYSGPILAEYHYRTQFKIQCRHTDKFYDTHITHTKTVTNKKHLAKYCKKFDKIIVGSDQVWRKSIAKIYGIETFFLDFIPESSNIERIAYGASFGVANNELQKNEMLYLGKYYKKFSMVSVREKSGITLIQNYGWANPKASLVLDPTLLLTKEDYENLLLPTTPRTAAGKFLLCYILDPDNEKETFIELYSKEHNLETYYVTLGSVSVEKWIASFIDAEYIITDSYHGVIFSIIMKKKFHLFGNDYRGNARFESLFDSLGITPDGDNNWDAVEQRIQDLRLHSIQFLQDALQNEK